MIKHERERRTSINPEMNFLWERGAGGLDTKFLSARREVPRRVPQIHQRLLSRTGVNSISPA